MEGQRDKKMGHDMDTGASADFGGPCWNASHGEGDGEAEAGGGLGFRVPQGAGVGGILAVSLGPPHPTHLSASMRF